jgi:hypothetical protein
MQGTLRWFKEHSAISGNIWRRMSSAERAEEHHAAGNLLYLQVRNYILSIPPFRSRFTVMPYLG